MEIVLIFTQDRCVVCVEHTIEMEIMLDAPDGTPRCVVCVERTIGMEILLDGI
jgi:hypothetical protein